MKHIVFVLLVTSYTIFACGFFTCKEVIYVSPLGSDANVGNKHKPLQTIEAALNRIKKIREEGEDKRIEIRLRAGTYYIPETIILSDECYSDISFVGDGMNQTIISGGYKIEGIIDRNKKPFAVYLSKESQDNIRELRTPQLFVNGTRMTLARTPNTNTYYIPEKYEWKKDSLNKKGGLIEIGLTEDAARSLDNVTNEQSIIVSFLHEWCESRRNIVKYNFYNKSIIVKDPTAKSRQYFKRKGAMQLFFENDFSFLDEPGEYFFNKNNGSFYYMPVDGDGFNNEEFVVPINRTILKILGEKNNIIKNISFKGITFEYTQYTMPEEGEEPCQASSQSLSAIMIDYAEKVTFKDCEFRHTGEGAVWFKEGCYDCSVQNCYLHDLGSGGLLIGITYSPFQMEQDYKITHHVKINNNIIKEGGRILFPGVGISLFQASDCVITHNEIADFYYTGISAGWTWGYAESPAKRNNISYNHIHHLGWGALSDLGGIYTLGRSEGTEIINNIIHHVYSFADNAWGIYLDEGTSNVLVKDNVVYDCKTSAFFQHYGKDNTILNNLFITTNPIDIAKAEKHISLKFDNNVVCRITEGPFWGETLNKSKVKCSNNLLWCMDADNLNNMDPGLSVDERGVYKVTNRAVLKRIGFKKIDNSKTGVYGSHSWKSKASFNRQRSILYDSITK